MQLLPTNEVHQAIDQAIKQFINQAINQSIHQSVHQPTNQSIKRSDNQSIDRRREGTNLNTLYNMIALKDYAGRKTTFR